MADTTIRRLPWSAEPAQAQLAGGAAMLAGLEQTEQPALRWCRIGPPALLLGSSQRPHEADLDACAADGVRVYRRGSGGGVVLSEGLLMLDLALPRSHRLFLDDVTASYRWIGEVWAAALRDLGLQVRTVPVDEARADAQALDPLLKRVCYAGLSPYEVVAGRRKVVGLAQIRRRGGALYQAGVYLRWEPWRTAALVRAEAAERTWLADQLAERVVGLDELCGRDGDAAAVACSFEAALARLAGLAPADDGWAEIERAAREGSAGRYDAVQA